VALKSSAAVLATTAFVQPETSPVLGPGAALLAGIALVDRRITKMELDFKEAFVSILTLLPVARGAAVITEVKEVGEVVEQGMRAVDAGANLMGAGAAYAEAHEASAHHERPEAHAEERSSTQTNRGSDTQSLSEATGDHCAIGASCKSGSGFEIWN
jgi:hypothetical protein